MYTRIRVLTCIMENIFHHVITGLGMERMYRTGDYGKIVNGVLLYEGRTDSQIKVRGHRVDLTEVETAIHKLSDLGIDKLAVLCYKPGETEQVYFSVLFIFCDLMVL